MPHASGRAAGLFKSVQADELRTGLARRSIAKALRFGDWAGVELDVTRSGSYLIARTAAHQELLRTEQRQSREWGVDIRAASAGEVTANVSYYQASGSEFALWCPEDVYIAEPTDLMRAYVDARRWHGAELLEHEQVMAVTLALGQVAGIEDRSPVHYDEQRRRRGPRVDQAGGQAGQSDRRGRAGQAPAAGSPFLADQPG